MQHTFFLFVIFIFLSGMANAQESKISTNTVESIVEKIRTHTAEHVVPPVESNDISLSLPLAQKAATTNDAKLKEDVLDHCINIELKHPRNPKYKTRSDNYVLLEQLISVFEKGGISAGNIGELFHPTDIDRYANRIRSKVYATSSRDLELWMLSLYAILPSNKTSEVKAFIQKLSSAPDFYYKGEISPVFLGILARYGDKTSEDTLIKYAEKFGVDNTVGYDRITEFENALVLANTSRVKKMLAEGLRSNKVIATPGNRTVSREEVYERALNRIFRDDPTYPFPNKRYLSWEEVGVLEQWCVKHLSIKVSTPFPDQPVPLDLEGVQRPLH